MISVALPFNKRLSAWERFGILHSLAENPLYLVLLVGAVVLLSVGVGVGSSFYFFTPTQPTPQPTPQQVSFAAGKSKTVFSDVLLSKPQGLVYVFISLVRNHKFLVGLSVTVLAVLVTLAVVFVVNSSSSNAVSEDLENLDFSTFFEEEEEEINVFGVILKIVGFILAGIFGVLFVWASKPNEPTLSPSKQGFRDAVSRLFTELPATAPKVSPVVLGLVINYEGNSYEVNWVGGQLTKQYYTFMRDKINHPLFILTCGDDALSVTAIPVDSAFFASITDADADALTNQLQTSPILNLKNTKRHLVACLQTKLDGLRQSIDNSTASQVVPWIANDNNNVIIVNGPQKLLRNCADKSSVKMYRWARDEFNIAGNFVICETIDSLSNTRKLIIRTIPNASELDVENINKLLIALDNGAVFLKFTF